MKEESVPGLEQSAQCPFSTLCQKLFRIKGKPPEGRRLPMEAAQLSGNPRLGVTSTVTRASRSLRPNEVPLRHAQD